MLNGKEYAEEARYETSYFSGAINPNAISSITDLFFGGEWIYRRLTRPARCSVPAEC
jgi:hypothetical protein